MPAQLRVIKTGTACALWVRYHAFEHTCDDRRGNVVVEQAVDKVCLVVRQDCVRTCARNVEAGGWDLLQPEGAAARSGP